MLLLAMWQWVLAAFAVGALLVLGVLLGLRLSPGTRRLPPASGAPSPTPVTTSAPVPPAPVPPTQPDRGLVLGLIGAHDLADGNQAVRGHVEQVLRRYGVTMLVAEQGAPFNPDIHSAVGTRTLGPGEVAGSIDGVVRPGWRSGAVVIRPAEVVVRT